MPLILIFSPKSTPRFVIVYLQATYLLLNTLIAFKEKPEFSISQSCHSQEGETIGILATTHQGEDQKCFSQNRLW